MEMTPEQIKALAKQAGGIPSTRQGYPRDFPVSPVTVVATVVFDDAELVEFTRLVRESALEEAAKICDELMEIPAIEPRHCAQDIRIRSFAK